MTITVSQVPAVETDAIHDHLVYFIRSGEYVKIGTCRRGQLFRRLTNLQVGNPEKLELLGAFPGPTGTEGWVHRDWEHLRVRGEWFRLTPHLREDIRRTLADEPPNRGELLEGTWQPT